MCGIVGLLSRGAERRDEAVAHARDLLSHRGPEGDGLWTTELANGRARLTLGHRRLCIIDANERSAQPMLLTPGGRARPAGGDAEAGAQLALTFNGEIYNYVELRTELQALGHGFHTTGDVEVLLLAYAEWGERCVDRLNGMFAFAIWDAEREQLFCARDRFGEKPFHYVLDERRGVFAFGSEVKALIGLGAADGTLDDRAVYRYFRFGEQAGAEQTIWSGVRRLPPAHSALIGFRDAAPWMSTRRYWTLPARGRESSDADAIARFQELFADSVRLRLRSDVPVGSSLSGGLDSSSVVCEVSRLGAATGQHAFTASMDELALDETRYAAIITAHTGVIGHTVTPTADALVEEFDRLFFHQEDPFPSTSIFASYLVQRLAREHGVTVLLDGQGADEYLAGYAHYPAAALVDFARRGQLGRWRLERRALATRTGADPVPPRAALLHWWRARRGFASALEVDGPRDVGFLEDDFARAHAEEGPRTVRLDDGMLGTRLRADLLEGHLQELLRYADRNAMAFSRETRLPFLDHRLVEHVMTAPIELSYRDGESKWVLRRAMRGTVPDAVLDRRDKVGFVTPWARWLEGPHQAVFAERLCEAERELHGVVRPGALDTASPAALGVMAIASARTQLRVLAPRALVGSGG
jgi:asparagine synthase (glutamine-hydrolysing)